MVQSRLIFAWVVLAASAVQAGELDAAMGRALFNRNWVAAPSSTQSDDGLGPLYDARSCNACHTGGGPGQVAAIGRGSVVRIGDAGGHGDLIYGRQFQISALPGFAPEAEIAVTANTSARRVFEIAARHFGYGAPSANKRYALRRAPSLRGIGYLARISGARFGWKATEPTIASQVEVAFMRDIGLSTTGHPDPWGECTPAERQCRAAPGGAAPGQVEIPDPLRDMIVAYVTALSPPVPLHMNAPGDAVFASIGCVACHSDPRALTDMRLHDMGPGLDDGIAEGAAGPSQWRTAPLWDIPEELARGGLLHDGRARDVTEAIAWHGGEASRARERFTALTPVDKAALVAFLMGK